MEEIISELMTDRKLIANNLNNFDVKVIFHEKHFMSPASQMWYLVAAFPSSFYLYFYFKYYLFPLYFYSSKENLNSSSHTVVKHTTV